MSLQRLMEEARVGRAALREEAERIRRYVEAHPGRHPDYSTHQRIYARWRVAHDAMIAALLEQAYGPDHGVSYQVKWP